MSEHTPEPWAWNGVDGVFTNPGSYKDDLNGPLIAAYIADCESHPLGAAQSIANAKRIVACVNACAGMADPASEIAALRERIAKAEAERDAARAEAEKLREFAESVLNWSEAYPEKIFNEPTALQINAVCDQLNITMDCVSAAILRHFIKPWGDNARAALEGAKEQK